MTIYLLLTKETVYDKILKKEVNTTPNFHHPYAPTKKKLLIYFSGTLVFLLIIFLMQKAGISCIYKYFFGLECPGCGMTRAFLSFLRLDFKAAFSYHPMVFFMPLTYIFILFNGRLFNNKKLDNLYIIFLISGFLINYLYKLFFKG